MVKQPKKPRMRVSQADVPTHGLKRALRVAQAIAKEHGKQPTRPMLVAQAMELKPTSSHFRTLCGSSIAYGLTKGGYNAKTIELTALGRRVVAPTEEGDDRVALREAALKPRVLREFLERYDGSQLPSERIGKNVLEEMQVPNKRVGATYQLILASAQTVGVLREIKGSTYVDLQTEPSSEPKPPSPNGDRESRATEAPDVGAVETTTEESGVSDPPQSEGGTKDPEKASRVFITHGSDREVVDQLKELLTFGGFIPVVAMEHETISKPVPDKVMDEMRTCGAAIVHVGSEQAVLDQHGDELHILNSNVLIEIGAAMALYRRRFILLVESGVDLPSNLQGLYEVRYEGGRLEYDATMRLLRAFNDFRE
ncbi:MAG: hypothetical protein F4Z50_11380 [Gemmatimonadetes bacterium]|nr:hypothetical protein [Gemmatimonadota bacterium]MYC91818.1 hypothetical protein [Gemmatimonadota bacterium]